MSKFGDLIRDVENFPQKGILFKDITPLLRDKYAFRSAVKEMAGNFVDDRVDYVVAVEARGYLFGAPVSYELGCGFIPVRKEGKLPWKTLREEYLLEYGSGALEMHIDSLKPNQRVLIVDDLLATGGTLKATINLVEKSGATVVGIAVLVDLIGLMGSKNFEGYKLVSLSSI